MYQSDCRIPSYSTFWLITLKLLRIASNPGDMGIDQVIFKIQPEIRGSYVQIQLLQSGHVSYNLTVMELDYRLSEVMFVDEVSHYDVCLLLLTHWRHWHIHWFFFFHHRIDERFLTLCLRFCWSEMKQIGNSVNLMVFTNRWDF